MIEPGVSSVTIWLVLSPGHFNLKSQEIAVKRTVFSSRWPFEKMTF